MLSQQQLSSIRNILDKSMFVKEAWLFGSFAKNKETDKSDIDIMYTDVEGQSYGMFALMNIIIKIQETTGKKVDFVHVPSMMQRVRENADKYKIKIYER